MSHYRIQQLPISEKEFYFLCFAVEEVAMDKDYIDEMDIETTIMMYFPMVWATGDLDTLISLVYDTVNLEVNNEEIGYDD